ncbi:5-histidylcysteine sulfoxide synthase [Sulfurimonas sp.]|uniref:5-histidylcysteine sulfoxide synthase n=1 Tax=Sulfurimonas sp. TaxID=2022749 RepID=UPI002B48D073|nr:5-histidylcysteine sulfoxide synthase [Sulfurimonas sp.]
MNNLSRYPLTLSGNNIEKKRQEIKEYFHNTFNLYEKVFELLKNDDVFYTKSEVTRHPMIFYFGHTATFFVNKLINMKIINKRINADFESTFAVGVDEMAWDDTNTKNYAWPSVDEVREYRVKVKELIDELVMTLPLALPIKQDSDMWIILMGIEHERIHIETSLVLHRQMPIDCIKEVSSFRECTHNGIAPKNEMLDIEAQNIRLGKDKSHNLYGWDNEYGEYEEEVGEFKASKFLVSNEEFMKFVDANGYEKHEYWDKEGLEYLKNSNAKFPVFWVRKNDKFYYRTLSKIIELPMNFPVEVNALEAEAYCRYKSSEDNVTYLLPSEAEYRAIYNRSNLQDLPEFHESRANLNFYHYASCCPVDEFSFNGIYDVVGNVWQWSRTSIFGFDGFEVHEAYDDFSVPTFDGKHALIVGSSWASSGNLIMKHSRYAFRKHFPQFSGFRYVVLNSIDAKVSAPRTLASGHIYESDELVSQYCEFQYGDEHFGVKNFAIEMAKIASKYSSKKAKALDLGCATGRATFELAKSFDKVEGIDFSVRFVQVGSKLKEDGFVAFHTKQEGEIVENKKLTIKELGYDELRKKVSFWQGDACNLKQNFNSYDMIMATNLIDRLYNPRLFLDTIDERLNKDGILIIASPYTWQESSTKKELWLGGYIDANGENIKTIDSLKEILLEKFKLIHLQDLEFVIKETQRKYQHTISEVSVWKKR